MPRLKAATDANGTKFYPVTITQGVYDTDKDQKLSATLQGKYEKPSTGIPKSDLASAVQTSLGKADSALQSHQTVSNKNADIGTSLTTIATIGSTDIKAKITHQDISGKADKATTLAGYGITDALSSSTKYAGSSSVGGPATSAAKLTNTTKIGDTNKPIYFTASGVPTPISYTIDKSVPSNAVFTDTTYENKAAASGGTEVSLVTTGDKYNWDHKTSNEGTVYQVTPGVGLSGSTITTYGTIKANLKSETQSTLVAAAKGNTANREYAVGVDKNGNLSVNVPWTDTTPGEDTDTKYKFTIGTTTRGDANGVDLGTLKSETAASGGTTLSLVTTGEKAIWNAKTDNVGNVTGSSLTANNIVLGNGNSAIKASSVSIETSLSASSDAKIATSKAIATYVSSQISSSMTSVLKYKGTIGTGGTVTSLPASHAVGDVYVVLTAGTYAGKACEVGDYIICNTAGTTATDSHWDVVNGENQVENKSASLAAAGSTATIATVDGINITVTTPSTWTGLTKVGTVTDVKVNSASVVSSGVATIPNASTSAYGATKLSSATNSTSEALAATPKAVKAAYDLAAGKQSPATTLSGYGITDAKIANGTITLGANTITPLTSYTETDPVFSASAAAGITSANITNWNKAEANVVKSVNTTAGTSGVNLSLSSAGALDVTISSGSIASGNTNFVTGGTVYSTTSTLAPKASPSLTGTPTAPTAAAGTNTTQIATTAFVTTAVTNGVASIVELTEAEIDAIIAEPA